jgi:hypothetical protein
MSAKYIDFAELKQRVSIHQVALSMLGLKLTQKGDQYRGTCPIHKSHDAAKEIAEHFGTVHAPPAGTVHKPPATTPPAPAAQRQGFDPEAYAARLDPAATPLAPLGISEATLRAFKAGYANAGLLRGRLALPLHATDGTILGFCGRALDDNEPKLIFPKNFAPSSVAFNWHQVKDSDFVYLTLDPLDVLKAYQNGIENCVAALGNLSSDFLQVLSHWMDERQIASIEPM